MADAPVTPSVESLEMRIVELENRLKELQPAGPPEITPEDIKSFQKVASALGVGIDPRCDINPPPNPPNNPNPTSSGMTGGNFGGGGRFGGLGE